MAKTTSTDVEEVDGMGSVDEVSQRLLSALAERLGR